MVSLGAARLGTLMRYRAGTVQVMKLFPRHWGVLCTTELRSERWGRICEHLEGYLTLGVCPPGFDPAAPWDLVIGVSAVGADGMNANWWQSHFLLPCTVTSAPGAASNMIRAVQGDGATASSSSMAALPPPQTPKGEGKGDRGSKRKGEKGGGRSDKQPPAEICKNYNSSTGSCATDGPCVRGRRHVCDQCGGNHRLIEKHGKRPNEYHKSGKDNKRARHD